tara:strand:- start:1309 stop:1470 length:162 start_codon:yes stop_codon:yes gene_type:complete
MSLETEQQEQRRIEDEIIDNFNYQEAESFMDLVDYDEEYIEKDAEEKYRNKSV